MLLLGLLVVLVAGCGGEALQRCESNVVNLEDYNRVCKEVLDQTHGEKQQLQEDLALAQGENQDLLQKVEHSQAENQDLQDTLSETQSEKQQLQDENQQLQDALAGSQDEVQQLQETLADAQAEIEELREGLVQPEPDLDSVRERLWFLFHDSSPAVWACDDTASRVVPVVEMPSASPADLVEAINDRFQELNPEYESPGLALEGLEGDSAVVSLARANVVTEQMGSTGAQCYLAGVTFSLTSFDTIDHVRFEFKEGSHGTPGRYDRADFVYFLPLEAEQP
jgi:predicted nuclease with TOPRIM domain